MFFHLHPASLHDTDLGWWDTRAKPRHILTLWQKGCTSSHQAYFVQWLLVALLAQRTSPEVEQSLLGLPLKHTVHTAATTGQRPWNACAVVHCHLTVTHSAAELWDWACSQELCPTDKFNSYRIPLHFKWHMVQSLLLLPTLTLKDPLSSLSASAEPDTSRGKSQGLSGVLCNILTFVLLCNQVLFSICCCEPVNINHCSWSYTLSQRTRSFL